MLCYVVLCCVVLSYVMLCYVFLLTYSMQHSPSWEANWFAASREIPRILWNPKVYYRVHKCPPPVSILSQLYPVHIPTFYFFKIHLNIIFPLRLRLPSVLFLSGFLTKTLYTPLPSQFELHARQSPLYLFYHTRNIGWGVQTMKLLIMKFSPHHCYTLCIRTLFYLASVFSLSSSASLTYTVWYRINIVFARRDAFLQGKRKYLQHVFWNTVSTNLTLTTVDWTRTLRSQLAAVTAALSASVCANVWAK
jgi:hypothetical protein